MGSVRGELGRVDDSKLGQQNQLNMPATLEINLSSKLSGLKFASARFVHPERRIETFVYVSSELKPERSSPTNSECLRKSGVPQQALLVLLLRAFGSQFREDRLTLQATPVLTRSLVNILYRQMSPADTSKWLYTLVGLSPSARLQDWFKPWGSTSPNRNCQVVLPTGQWRQITFVVRINESPVPVPVSSYLALAKKIEREEPLVLPVAKVSIDGFELLLWDGIRAGFGSGFSTARWGDRIQLRIQTNQPAYLYILWSDSQGQIVTLYPWSGSNWEWKAQLAATQNLIFPNPTLSEDAMALQVEGPAGMEHLLVLASAEALGTKNLYLLRCLLQESNLLRRCPPTEVPVVSKFPGITRTGKQVRSIRRLVMSPEVKVFQSRLAEILTPHFDHVLICTFANKGKAASSAS